MVFRPNEHMRFPTGERMQSHAAGGMYMSAASLPVMSWQCAGHGTMEKFCAGYQLEMGVLKMCFTQIALENRLSSWAVKPDYNFCV